MRVRSSSSQRQLPIHRGERGQGLARSGQGALALVDRLLDVAFASGNHPQGYPCLGGTHGGAFGAVEVGARPDDLIGQGLGHFVLGQSNLVGSTTKWWSRFSG
jgi:hypothetical protein